MIREINISDMKVLINFRTKLLQEINNNLANYDRISYSKSLEEFYEENINNNTLIGHIYEENSIPIGFCSMFFYKGIPFLSNMDGKMAMQEEFSSY